MLSHTVAVLLRALAATWRIRVHDLSGLGSPSGLAQPPVIWVLWHNRLIVVPILYRRLFTQRKGTALISQSKDGALLADCIRRFGGEAVRGSSSRGGASALAELRRKIDEGYDVYITPDGPRGPRYSMKSGATWLAQASGAKIQPLSVEVSRCWRLGRWDGFIIPKPFSKVTITLQPFHSVVDSTEASVQEEERLRLQRLMVAGTELH